jgi:hypothetical protein
LVVYESDAHWLHDGHGVAQEYAVVNHHGSSADNWGHVAVHEYAVVNHHGSTASADNHVHGRHVHGMHGESAVLRGTLACQGGCEHRVLVRVIHDVRRDELLFYFNESNI